MSQSSRENDDVRGVDDPDARPGPGSLPSDLRARAPQDVRRAVVAELERMERAEDVRVLLAVESGSRAWGFASPDSDFDVRFVYVRPVEHYLRLEPARDVLEWRIDEVLDVDGWDADKALRLLRGSNPSLFEWLASPIVYAEDPAFAVVRELAADCFSLAASAHHYLPMGRNHLAALNAWAAGALAQVTGALADVEPPAPVPWERLDEAFLALVGPAAWRGRTGV